MIEDVLLAAGAWLALIIFVRLLAKTETETRLTRRDIVRYEATEAQRDE